MNTTLLQILARVLAWMSLGCLPICHAQDYPNKPIRILTTEPGSGSDVVARVLAQAMLQTQGQQVVVDNRGAISAELAARAAPDGYTLLLNGQIGRAHV